MSDPSTSTAVATATPLQDKFEKLRTVMGVELIERSTVIDTLILALLSRTHHFQLGSPGVAKSLSTQRLIDHIEAGDDFDPATDYFETLMTRFTVAEEVMGPLDLQALQNSRYRHMTDGYFPDAKVVFLDEIWKSNASILNALLWALNERKMRNDGAVNPLPLWSMFCASNEMPEGEELNALYDRIHFRILTRPIQEPGSFINMLKLSSTPAKEKILTWTEIETAANEAAAVVIPDDVLEALVKVKSDLRAEGIEPTDRRFRECLKVVRAEAWLNGQTTADIEHLRSLAHVLWTTQDEQPTVERQLLELANPLDKEAMNLLETVDKLSADLDKVIQDKSMDTTLRNKKGVELHNKVERSKEDLQKLIDAVEKSGRKSAKTEEVRTRLLGVTKRLLTEVFGIAVDDNLSI